MSIFIVNDTTADNVRWTIEGVPASGPIAPLSGGTLMADIQNNTFVFNPPASPVYPSFRVGFSPIATSGHANAMVPNQSEVHLALVSQIDLPDAPHNGGPNQEPLSISGLQIVNDATANLTFSVYGQIPLGSGRTLIESSVIASGHTVNISGAAMSEYNFFDVEISGVGTGAGQSGNATVTIQDNTKITFAVFHSGF